MPILTQKTSNHFSNNQGFSLIEILVALLLAALVFLAVPSGDSAQKHRELKTAVEDIDRSIRFASNEAVLRNTVVRLRIAMDKEPVEYFVEYGPAGNLPLPDLQNDKKSLSLEEEKQLMDKQASLNRLFTKVEEFDEIKHELSPNVTILGLATESQKKLVNQGDANIYFYPTGEKDASVIFFNTSEELSYIVIEPFMSETNIFYEPLKKGSVAKPEDLFQTRMDEVFREWQSK